MCNQVAALRRLLILVPAVYHLFPHLIEDTCALGDPNLKGVADLMKVGPGGQIFVGNAVRSEQLIHSFEFFCINSEMRFNGCGESLIMSRSEPCENCGVMVLEDRAKRILKTMGL